MIAGERESESMQIDTHVKEQLVFKTVSPSGIVLAHWNNDITVSIVAYELRFVCVVNTHKPTIRIQYTRIWSTGFIDVSYSHTQTGANRMSPSLSLSLPCALILSSYRDFAWAKLLRWQFPIKSESISSKKHQFEFNNYLVHTSIQNISNFCLVRLRTDLILQLILKLDSGLYCTG